MDRESDWNNEDEVDVGIPAYMATFADLMALLLCFFVLLLSFSEMDALKYKTVVESLDDAFGVQRDVVTFEIPKGTSVIAQDFSPSIPEPTPIQVVKQITQDAPPEHLKSGLDRDSLHDARLKLLKEEADDLKAILSKEIGEGLIEVSAGEDRVVISIREKGSFPSGDAGLNPDFLPILKRITEKLATTEGQIIVAGHTDDIPIQNNRYNSNWALSTARAMSVIHEMETLSLIDSGRFLIEGHADKKPVADNKSDIGRAKNRRVEISIIKPLTPSSDNDV